MPADARKLYSFIIVDDEPIIRDGIRDNIPWEELGFAFSGACADGNEAVELIEKINPDVVMTDICMPFLDGIALGSWIAERLPSTRIIMLTGFDDFEYAQKAVKLKAYDFLLKPVTPRELKDLLAALKKELDEEFRLRGDLEALRVQLAESLPLLRERLLYRLLTEDVRNLDLADRFSSLQIPLPLRDVVYQTVIIDLNASSRGDDYSLDLISATNTIGRTLSGSYRHILFEDPSERRVILAWSDRPQSLFRETLAEAELLARALPGSIPGTVTIGIGETVSGIERIRQSYQGALRALSFGVLQGGGKIVTVRELTGVSRTGQEQPLNWGKQIAEALRVSSAARVSDCIDRMVEYFCSRSFPEAEYRFSLQVTFASILQVLDDLEIPVGEVLPGEPDPFARIRSLKTREDIRGWFSGLCARITGIISLRQEDFSRSKVREAEKYIESRYADPGLSLRSICSDLSVSTSYFSLIFKKHTGKTFIEYLTDARIRIAMELLRTTPMKTSDIAQQVGYGDSHYFSLIFRKTTGEPPTAYRSRFSP